MKVFFSNYHISVNDCVVRDLLAIGNEVVMPSQGFGAEHIGFFAPNNEFESLPGVRIVDYIEWLGMESMAVIIPCNQMYDDFMRLYEARGKKDTLIYLTALSTTVGKFPLDGSDFIITHDLNFHRATKARYKMLYFSKPKMLIEAKKDIAKCFAERKLKQYINNFDTERFLLERIEVDKLEKVWGNHITKFGYGMPEGWLSMEESQKNMLDSMFTVVIKRPETWGQAALESMLNYTPCIFLKGMMNSTFREYLINDDTAIIGESVAEIVEKITALELENYETMCIEAQSQANLYTNDANRQAKLKWLLSKI